MINRRLFLKTSSATLASIASINPALAKGCTGKRGTVIDLVLYDDRVDASSRFATDAKSNGSAILSIQDDLTEASFGQLQKVLTEQEAVIGGYTTPHAASYVLGLARDYQYQQVHFTDLEPELRQLLDDAGQKDALTAWVLAPMQSADSGKV